MTPDDRRPELTTVVPPFDRRPALATVVRGSRSWILLAAVVALGALPTLAQTPGRGGAFTRPSVSVRETDPASGRVAMTRVLGWRLAARTDAVGAPTFWEGAAIADAAGLAYVELVDTQKVSAEIPRNLDHNLTAAEVDKVLARLDELRLRVAAYRLEAPLRPNNVASLREAFQFGKRLGAPLIIAAGEPRSFAACDQVATELDVNVVVLTRDVSSAVRQMSSLSDRIGLELNPTWLAPGRGRIWALNLDDEGKFEQAFVELARQNPPARPTDYPRPYGVDAGGARQTVRPVVVTLDLTAVADPRAELKRRAAAVDAAVRPAIREYVDQLARLTAISTTDRVPVEQRQRVDAAIPRQALTKPRKPRTLLVLDLAYNGSFYHASTPLGNLSLELMSRYTGAFTPVFSNDLENLHYPRIKQFDGVFLNQIQGDVFDDDRAIEGLMRSVREGGGVVGLHAATWASTNTREFGELMGATSGAHKYNGEWGAVRVDDAASPLTRHFEGKGFEFLDEFYHYVPAGPFSREKLHVLLSLDPARTDLPANQYTTRPDNDYGLVWIRTYGEGRVFNSGLGHRPEFYEAPKMQQMLLAAVQFVLGDLEADAAPSGRR